MCKELIYFLSDIENNDKADDENCYFLPHKEGVLIKQVHKEVPCLIDYAWDEPRKYASINNNKYTPYPGAGFVDNGRYCSDTREIDQDKEHETQCDQRCKDQFSLGIFILF